MIYKIQSRRTVCSLFILPALFPPWPRYSPLSLSYLGSLLTLLLCTHLMTFSFLYLPSPSTDSPNLCNRGSEKRLFDLLTEKGALRTDRSTILLGASTTVNKDQVMCQEYQPVLIKAMCLHTIHHFFMQTVSRLLPLLERGVSREL